MREVIHLKDHPFGDGVYDFALTPRDVMLLEAGRSGTPLVTNGGIRVVGRSSGRPIFQIFNDIVSGRVETIEGGTIGNPFTSRASQTDILAIVGLALVGGGRGVVDGEEIAVDEYVAADLLDRYGPPHRPLTELWDIAAAIVYAYLIGNRAEVANG